MKCNKCGKVNDDSKIFCDQCGERLVAAPDEVSVGGTPIMPDESSQKANSSSTQGTQNSTQNNASTTNATSANKSSANSQTNSKAKSYEVNELASPLSRAWGDITHSPKWFGKGIIVGLINCVPILSFATSGYAQKWGVEADLKKTGQMPKKYVTGDIFLCGFFEWVTWIVWLIAWAIGSWIISASLGSLPLIGVLIGLALFVASIFWNSIISLASMKCAIKNELGQSFNVKEIFTKWTKGWGELFTSYFVPSILCGLIGLGIGLIFLAIGAASIVPSITSIFSGLIYNISATDITTILYNYLPVIMKLIGSGFFVILLCIIEFCICDGFSKLIRYRAVGYWIDKYAKEWK